MRFSPEIRGHFTATLTLALPLIGAVIALAAAGGFAPAWHQVTGAAGGYNEANRIAFGATTGGYGPLVQDADGIALAFRCLLVAVLALPAWSAITMLPTPVLLVRRSPEDRVRMVLLSLSGVALVASAYPRWDLTHLGYVSAIPFALLAMGLRSVLPARAFRAVCAAGLVLALVPLAAFLEKGGRRDVETAIGKLSATPQDAALLEELARHVGLRATGWIYPYQPALGFYLGLENPTPYSFLQPGMARPEDERLAAEALERTQPPLLIRVEAPAHAYLRIWPAANLEAIQLPQLDAFVNSRYRSVAVLPHPAGPFRILALSPPATTVRGPAR